VIDRHVDERERVGARRALQVFPLQDRDLLPWRRHQHGRVAEVGALAGGHGGLGRRGNAGQRHKESGSKNSGHNL
jgi:hypothetical protein